MCSQILGGGSLILQGHRGEVWVELLSCEINYWAFKVGLPLSRAELPSQALALPTQPELLPLTPPPVFQGLTQLLQEHCHHPVLPFDQEMLLARHILWQLQTCSLPQTEGIGIPEDSSQYP